MFSSSKFYEIMFVHEKDIQNLLYNSYGWDLVQTSLVNCYWIAKNSLSKSEGTKNVSKEKTING